MQRKVFSVVLSAQDLDVVLFLNLAELLSDLCEKAPVSNQEAVLAFLDDVGDDGFEAVDDLTGQRGVLRRAFASRGAGLGS